LTCTQALEQEKSARKILEAENLALRNALSQAQQGMQDVPITQTADHIHAVSMGLISPWEGMAQSESQVKSLENEVKGASLCPLPNSCLLVALMYARFLFLASAYTSY